jgi:hypothetical protein
MNQNGRVHETGGNEFSVLLKEDMTLPHASLRNPYGILREFSRNPTAILVEFMLFPRNLQGNYKEFLGIPEEFLGIPQGIPWTTRMC